MTEAVPPLCVGPRLASLQCHWLSVASRGSSVDRYGERKSDTRYLFQGQNAAPPHRLEFLSEQLCPAPSVGPEWA